MGSFLCPKFDPRFDPVPVALRTPKLARRGSNVSRSTGEKTKPSNRDAPSVFVNIAFLDFGWPPFSPGPVPVDAMTWNSVTIFVKVCKRSVEIFNSSNSLVSVLWLSSSAFWAFFQHRPTPLPVVEMTPNFLRTWPSMCRNAGRNMKAQNKDAPRTRVGFMFFAPFLWPEKTIFSSHFAHFTSKLCAYVGRKV